MTTNTTTTLMYRGIDYLAITGLRAETRITNKGIREYAIFTAAGTYLGFRGHTHETITWLRGYCAGVEFAKRGAGQ